MASVLYASGERVQMTAGAEGEFLLAERAGVVRGATGLGAFDSLLRLALSLTLPLDGALLLHAAALKSSPATGDGAVVLCGASGAGKSTAARALGAVCDELVMVRGLDDNFQVTATPYWQGQPSCERLSAIVCLERGAPKWVPLRRGEAVRTLLAHAVRYAPLPRVDRALFEVVTRTVAHASVYRAVCPEGDAFLPFLTGSLNSLKLEHAA
jgi:hypothetical protein